jgi:hypothetical protein
LLPRSLRDSEVPEGEGGFPRRKVFSSLEDRAEAGGRAKRFSPGPLSPDIIEEEVRWLGAR